MDAGEIAKKILETPGMSAIPENQKLDAAHVVGRFHGVCGADFDVRVKDGRIDIAFCMGRFKGVRPNLLVGVYADGSGTLVNANDAGDPKPESVKNIRGAADQMARVWQNRR